MGQPERSTASVGLPGVTTRPKRKPTTTSAFGAGRRESHDSSGFYERFIPPTISEDNTVERLPVANRILLGDARTVLRSERIPDNCVALVVTSPPYFVGKEYEEALGEGHVPATYLEYLSMLRDVFAECVRVLEPGGRIAVNVANLGRRPYRSLSADVTRILQDDLKLLLRGELIWYKQEGATGSTAWGSFQSPANPVLRDLTERVMIASKGRFDRALSRRARSDAGLPYEITIPKDEFMEVTTDVWRIDSESATRVGHPAPFPVLLPQRLIELYTYRDDVVLDPFMGSGSAAIAAVRTGRRFLGCEIDDGYRVLALERIQEEERRRVSDDRDFPPVLIGLPGDAVDDHDDNFQRRAVRQGKAAREIARQVLEKCGFTSIVEKRRLAAGVEVNFCAVDALGEQWFFDVSGALTSSRPGLQRTDTVWKALGKAAVLKAKDSEKSRRLVFLTTHLPEPGSSGWAALDAAQGEFFHDAIPMLTAEGLIRLRQYCEGEGRRAPLGKLLAATDG